MKSTLAVATSATSGSGSAPGASFANAEISSRDELSYRLLTEGALYGIYRSTVEGRFLSVNPALVAMLGYSSQEELLSVDMAGDVYADKEERGRLIAQYRDSGRISGVEVEWKRKDGKPITVRLSGRPVRDETGRLTCFEMIVEDVTERRALEAQLRQSQKMEAIGQLTGGIAHDFNNMLTVILANADLLASEVQRDRADLRTIVEETRTAAQRGCDLIRQLLSVSRRSKLDLRPTDLAELVSGMSDMLRRVLPDNVDVQVTADRAAGLAAADAGAVEQIILNLLTNARDAMPQGGHLGIEVKRDRLDEWYESTHPWVEPGEYISISVSDTGIGMDEATKERVFEPFFTTKPVGRGTGLGMAMIYGLVKQHKGYVHIYSEPGRGTTVKTYFPLADASPQRVVERSGKQLACGGTETVLVVEDEPAIRRAAERALSVHGYKVVLASDGDEALRIIREPESGIDLIISDLVMPRKGGRELFEALRTSGCEIPLILTSGYSARDVEESAGLEGQVPFLHKPWTLVELLTSVRSALEGNNAQARHANTPDGARNRLASWNEVYGVPPVTESSWLTGWRVPHLA